MVDINEVNKEISTLESEDLTYRIAEKLAILYIVRNNNEQEEVKTRSIEKQSDFVGMCKCVDIDDLLKIFEEHMEAVKTIFPKEYDLIMKKINSLL